MNEKKPRLNDALKYSSLGIQMVAMIGICVFIGIQLDKKVQTTKPWFTLGFALFGVISVIVYMIRKL